MDYSYAQFLGCYVKKAYKTIHKAETKAREYNQRAYKCEFCPYWHLTSKLK